ncbi:MAG: outer membrane beta-barrel protein [Bacteroidota bacterium]
MSNFETRSAIALILALGLVATPAIAADTAAPQADAVATDATQTPAASTTWNSGGASGAVFGGETSGGVGVAQQSVTAGYELGGLGVAGGAAPAQGAIMTSAGRGRPIRFENGIFIYPSVLVGYGYNDNVTGRATDRITSTFWALRPEVVGEIKHGGDRYTLSYIGNYAHYDNSSNDDYTQHEIWAAGDNYFTSRARLGWGVGYLEKTDARGSTNRVSSNEPDRWHAPVLRALGIYGAPGAAGRIELEGSWMQKRYDNNRAFTEQSDVDLTTASGRFFYRVMPRTSLLFEARETWANYTSSTSQGDNTDRRLYAGVTWEATAKTTGTIKLGRAYKDFSDSSRTDSSLNSWEGSLRWSPLTYSTFDLVSSKTPSDSTGVGSFVTNTATSLTWNHKWASYISSRVNAGVVKTIYAGDPRKDNTKNYGVGFFTELGYRTRLGLDWQYTNRNANVDTFDFKRNVLMGTLEFVL